MAQSSGKSAGVRCPSVSRQIAFHQLLVSARKTWLGDALSEALAEADPKALKDQLIEFAPTDALKILASAKIRDEQVFPTPALLQIKPTLVGYYRLLAGIPQKSFYGAGTGLGQFKSMENSGLMTEKQLALLPEFCREMGRVLGEIVRQISPRICANDIAELPLLTLGAQFQGANNNRIGQQATKDVFLAIAKIVRKAVIEQTENRLTIKNSSGTIVFISLSSDPDVSIQFQQSGALRNKLAIEIKGGTDKSNAHNRAGEAEKSHQKARHQDFRECWTLIFKKGLNEAKLKRE